MGSHKEEESYVSTACQKHVDVVSRAFQILFLFFKRVSNTALVPVSISEHIEYDMGG